MLTILARTAFRIQERMLGRRSFAILRQLRRSQWFSRQELDRLRLRRLRRTVSLAYDHSPYWREVMERSGIQPASIASLDDLRRFPLLTKEQIRRRREEMLWAQAGRRVQLVRTSGSTNEALQFYTYSLREAHINAARMRGHEWVGVRRGEKEMYFWGSPVELSKQDRLKRIRDWLINDGLTNGFEITPQRVARYLDYWKRWRPKCIFGYPNSFVLLVGMARRQGLDPSVLKGRGLEAIITTSEMLGDINRRIIEEAFGVAVYDSYGVREAGLIAHECDHQTICACGRSLSSIEISGGRAVEFVVTNRGKWVVGYSFIYICRSVKGIVKFQVRQDRIGLIRILLVTDDNFPPDGIEQVARAARARLDSTDRIVVEQVENISPAPSGKYRPVISKVAEQMLTKDKYALEGDERAFTGP